MATTTIRPADIYNNVLHHAATELIQQKRYADLSYSHLQQLAIYTPDEAERVAVLRDQARARAKAEAAEPSPPTARAPQKPDPLPPVHELLDQFIHFLKGDDAAGEPWLAFLRKHERAPVSLSFLQIFVLDALKAMEEKNVGRSERIKALDDRVAALEARPPSLKYCGTWRAEDSYVVGDVATFKGAMWTCMAATRRCPGENADWLLCVKSGRDGKDAPR